MSTTLQITHEEAITDAAIVQQQSPQGFLDLARLSIKATCFATEIAGFTKASTQNTIAMCEVFFKAKHELGAEFSSLCSALNYTADSSTIKKYILIGEKAELFKPYLDRLPNTWTTLYQMTHLNGDELQQLLSNGQLNQATTGAQIKSVLKKRQVEPAKPKPRAPVTNSTASRNDSTQSDSQVTANGLSLKFDALPSPELILELESSILQFIQANRIHCRVFRTEGLDSFLTSITE